MASLGLLAKAGVIRSARSAVGRRGVVCILVLVLFGVVAVSVWR